MKSSKRSSTAGTTGPVTLAMVAQAAGVSPSTVSRVLNGTAVVSPDKRQAIDNAIAELGFVPNPVARGLAGGRTLSVGVITQSLDSPFYGVALRGIEEELKAAGYSALFVSGHWDAKEEAHCIDILRARRVDGIIVLTGRLSDAQLKNCAKHLPVVVTGRQLKAAQLFSLNFDNLEGAKMATKHLIARGHRRIAFITGNMDQPDAVERQQGYREALHEAGISFDPRLVVPGRYDEASGVEAADRLIKSRVKFSAIFAANDQMAVGAVLSLHQHGVRIPQEVAVMGFDDLYVCSHTYPPLSSVDHPAQEMGHLAARAMLQLLAGDKPSVVMPAPMLKLRASTA